MERGKITKDLEVSNDQQRHYSCQNCLLIQVWKRIVMKIRIKYHLNDINNDFETNLMEVAH